MLNPGNHQRRLRRMVRRPHGVSVGFPALESQSFLAYIIVVSAWKHVPMPRRRSSVFVPPSNRLIAEAIFIASKEQVFQSPKIRSRAAKGDLPFKLPPVEVKSLNWLIGCRLLITKAHYYFILSVISKANLFIDTVLGPTCICATQSVLSKCIPDISRSCRWPQEN